MKDFTFYCKDGTLAAKFKSGNFVVSTAVDGPELEIELPARAAKLLAEWLSESTPKQASPQQILYAAFEALTAMIEGKFVRKSSSDFWNLGFDVNSDDCEWFDASNWCAIHDPHENEIEIYVMGDDGDTGSAKINVSTGELIRT